MKRVISFDFDETLCSDKGIPNFEVIETLLNHAKQGDKVYIVTARDRLHESKAWIDKNQPDRVRVKDFIKQYNLPVKQCHFTAHELKGRKLKELNASIHYDDNPAELFDATCFGVTAIQVNKVK